MNMAFMGKFSWRMIKEKEKLWIKIIKTKYGWDNGSVDSIMPRKGLLNLWQGITRDIPLIRQGFGFTVRNGRQT